MTDIYFSVVVDSVVHLVYNMNKGTPLTIRTFKIMANTKKVSSSDLLKIIHVFYEQDPEGLLSDLAIYAANEESLLKWAKDCLESAEEEMDFRSVQFA